MYVPQYENLSLEKLLQWAESHCPSVVESIFPEMRELRKFPRQVRFFTMVLLPIYNSVFALLGFQEWVEPIRFQAHLSSLLFGPNFFEGECLSLFFSGLY